MNEPPPIGVYVHWPYCARICPYCDFNVYKNKQIDAERWLHALKRDLKYWAAKTNERKLVSLYFGGGTPSLAPLDLVAGVIETCENLWGFEADPEITLEANPTDAEQARFQNFADAGVNRLSLGVQSLNDEALKFLGRDHDAAAARRAIEAAQSAFKHYTFDLIYALPDQSETDWERDLKDALSFQPPHLSLYQLTIEPDTAFEKAVARKAWTPPDEGLSADLFALTQEVTSASGLPAYETSNHAHDGEASKHNLLYWRYQDYIGVGPGAHGRITLNGKRVATETHRTPEDYLTAVEQHGHGAALVETLDQEAQLAERLSMGLRLKEGIPLYADDYFYTDDARANRLNELVRDGFLFLDCGTLRATPKGAVMLNSLISRLLT